MKMPGFGAEASLYRSSASYYSATVTSSAGAGGSLTPQLMSGGYGVDGGGILTDIECGLRFLGCAILCGVEWIGWAGTSIGVANGLFEYCAANCEVDVLKCVIGLPPDPGIP
jgi:hypothetical protein